ncbi:4'-phosphopantetheinyl transferase superfamily protein [Algoriphagus sp. Y33]|uniref:4'-phosphopantetheinyl transferase family protein n=1 Tax=Algoriphagus sp. Y33 TaxID=2772483 RepID=UPI0017867E6A|nr:4'-phosphopantetheinyl transferase superfamily protein [Algoriphagus sp. Y33]
MEIHVVVAGNDGDLSFEAYARISELLTNQMREKVKSFHSLMDSQAFMIGKYLIVHSLKRFGYSDFRLDSIRFNDNGRPYLPGSNVDFNLSHAGNYVVCASALNVRIGIDIEKVCPLNLNDFSKVFTENELEAFDNANDTDAELIAHWTMKEAVIKADGRGFSISPMEIALNNSKLAYLHSQKWFIQHIPFDPKYFVHIACDQMIKPENIYIEKICI